VTERQPWVDAQRRFGLGDPLVDPRGVVVVAHENEPIGRTGLRLGKFRIERQRLLQQSDRLEILRAVTARQLPAPEKEGVGLQVVGRLLREPCPLGLRQVRLECLRDLLRDVALDREHTREFALVLLRPQGLARAGVDQLGAHPHAAPLDPHAPVNEAAQPQLAYRARQIVAVAVEPGAAEDAQC
jgi:hypothetical protein